MEAINMMDSTNKDWIDDLAQTASLEELEKTLTELIKYKRDVEDFEYKFNKLNAYIRQKSNEQEADDVNLKPKLNH